MKLFKYNQFLNLQPMNENVQKAKSYLKEFHLVGLAARELGFITEDMDYELKEGQRRVFLMKDFTPEQQAKIRNKIKGKGEFEGKGIKLSDEDVRKVESNPDFKKVKEIKVEIKDNDGKVKTTYQLDRNNPNWISNFTYFYFAENMSIEQLVSIYSRLIEFKDYLNKLPRPFDLNYINETIPNAEHPHGNGEDLSDELDKLVRFRYLNKLKETLPPHLKKALEAASEIQMEEIFQIAEGFMEFKPVEKRETIWKGFFGEMQEDTEEFTHDGKKNPHFGKVRYMSKLALIKDLPHFIKSAKSHLQSSASSGYSDKLELIDKTNKKYGSKGAMIVFNEGGVMVVKVYSYAANCFLNGDNRHCISGMGENYWTSYVGDMNIQYYVYNFNLPSTNPLSSIGVTIKPDRTYSSGACQNKTNTYIGGEFKSILKEWQKEYEIDVDIYNEVLNPMTKEEVEKIQKAKIAEREIVKRGLSAEQITKYVKEDGANINKDGAIALINAVMDGDIDKVKLCLDLGADPNLKKGSEGAMSKAKSIDLIKLLVQYGAQMTNEVYLNFADNHEVLEYLLKAGLDPNLEDGLPIRRACKGSYKNRRENGEAYTDIFKLLLKYNARIFRGASPKILKWATNFGRWELLKYIKEVGLDKEFTSEDFQLTIQWVQHNQKLTPENKQATIDYLQSEADRLKKLGK